MQGLFFLRFLPTLMMYPFRCDPCELVSTVYGLLQCIRSSKLERIVKRGTWLDNILIDLGQPLPPQFDHGDFNFWIYNKKLNWYTVILNPSEAWRRSLADSVNLNVIICHKSNKNDSYSDKIYCAVENTVWSLFEETYSTA